jgi:hypothetical protein
MLPEPVLTWSSASGMMRLLEAFSLADHSVEAGELSNSPYAMLVLEVPAAPSWRLHSTPGNACASECLSQVQIGFPTCFTVWPSA